MGASCSRRLGALLHIGGRGRISPPPPTATDQEISTGRTNNTNRTARSAIASPSALQRPLLDEYELQHIVGRGQTAVVWRARHYESGEERAVKQIPKKKGTSEKLTAYWEREVAALERFSGVDHENVISMHEKFEDSDFYYIVLDLCLGGELYYPVRQQQFSERRAAKIMFQVFQARSATSMTSYTTVGRIRDADLWPSQIQPCEGGSTDIKAENFLFETPLPESPVKLIDFGLSVIDTSPSRAAVKQEGGSSRAPTPSLPTAANTSVVPQPDESRSQTPADMRHPPAYACRLHQAGEEIPMGDNAHYIAPEVLKGIVRKESDIWSAGVLMWFLLSGSYPFDGPSASSIREAIAKEKYAFGSEWKDVSDTAKDFIRALLEVVHPVALRQAAHHVRWPLTQRHTKHVETAPLRHHRQGPSMRVPSDKRKRQQRSALGDGTQQGEGGRESARGSAKSIQTLRPSQITSLYVGKMTASMANSIVGRHMPVPAAESSTSPSGTSEDLRVFFDSSLPHLSSPPISTPVCGSHRPSVVDDKRGAWPDI
ncbi:unnamed protein product [Vitrella brassicaformis CCMP3155]|uniref:Protein kinase domain-containing protein n=1 Tax=Vitrella brassicaformis (strain CCMP3155) TaxID=1169540 RepID=A0A0G4FQE6_VITBC|nr:unnamed protein product [Vitrella brassicaformis CCMP3155]|eukprot:CEM16095.1 unnamed protein product [Vitrella brassicaformis CCMP3155]